MKVPNGDFGKFLKQESSEIKNINRTIPSGGVNIENNQVFTSIPHPQGIINLQPQIISNGFFSIPNQYAPCINQIPDNIKLQNQQQEQCPSNMNEIPNIMTLFPSSSSLKNEKNLKADNNTQKTGVESTNLIHQQLINQNLGTTNQQMLSNQGMTINRTIINNSSNNIPLGTNYLGNQCIVNNSHQNTNVFQTPNTSLQINEQIKNFLNSLKQNQPTNLINNVQQSTNVVPISTASTLSETTINHLINSMPGPSNISNIGTIHQSKGGGFTPQISVQQQPHILHNLRIPMESDCPQNSSIIPLSTSQQQQIIQQAILLSTTAPPLPTKEVVDEIFIKRKVCKPKVKIEGCEPLDISTVAGYPITCFIVAGEPRISFSEFSNTVLPHISVSAIHDAYQKFNMSTKCATDKQLLTLKLEGRIPVQLGTCTLITKSNAERLAGHFLCDVRHMDSFISKYDTSTFIKVIHNLFGGNTGLYYPYFPKTHCIKCIYCQFVFGPQKFLTHSHNTKSDKIAVWGYDDRKWRRYYNPPIDEKVDSMYLDIFKTLIIDNNVEPNRKRTAIDMKDEIVHKKPTTTNGSTISNISTTKNDTEKRIDNLSPVFPTPPGSEPSPSTGNIVTKPSITKVSNNTTTVVDVLPHQHHNNNLNVYAMTQPQNTRQNHNIVLQQQTHQLQHQQTNDNNKSAFVGIQQSIPNVTLSQNTIFSPSNSSPQQAQQQQQQQQQPLPLPQQSQPTIIGQQQQCIPMIGGNFPLNGLNSMQFNILINQLIQSQNYVDDPNKSLIESLAVLIPSNHLASVLTKLNNEFSNYKKEIELLKEQNKRMEKIIQVCINASDVIIIIIIKSNTKNINQKN
ncbi:Sno oncogene [Strongyloides ratti]|uniref:Sno oncogene n=1 Tax=Strongyloides ratti TaxID=34506 RepID=A0A090KVP4_STRRB|nr:Sno oncogene [Strongyloides ratti]CEF59312.1 Sno oncogene [Strongyloides ratti]